MASVLLFLLPLVLLYIVLAQDSSMVVPTDPANADMNKCLANNATGPITSQLNQPISGGEFTFYGAGGTGACGQDAGKPAMSAAVSSKLFTDSSTVKWVPPCDGGTQSVRFDAVCVGKCVKIEYQCRKCTSPKSLTVPINNECGPCKEPNHVDLSIPAFNYLEPEGGTVGIATNATITYVSC